MSFTRRPGRLLALVGESGCGKSVLAAAITGLAVVVALVAFLVAAGITVVSLVFGDYPIPVGDVAAALAGGSGSARRTAYVVLELRLPRALGAVAVGASFGLAGAIFQRLARNPLATPDVIGVNAGAAAGAVLLVVVPGAGPRGWELTLVRERVPGHRAIRTWRQG